MGELLRPRWVIAHVIVILVAVLFINLGFWQLRRLDERRLENTVGESRYLAEPMPLEDLLTGTGDDIDSLVFRRTFVFGIYQPSDEVLIRSRVDQGRAGFHVITPLRSNDRAVLVNRGWVPLILDRVPVEQAAPPQGSVMAPGWLSASQERGPLGPEDPEEGRLVSMNRIDIDRIQTQVDYPLAPVFINLSEDGESGLPIAAGTPSFDDEGPHLAYAIQWFGFTLVGVVGYFFLMRRTVRGSP